MTKNISTNIVYFTTTCNLSCTYCYQHIKDYPHINTTKDELKKIAEDIIEREPDYEQTLFVLFGGEPTIRWDDVKFFMDYSYSLKKNVQFNMVTNGIRFLDDSFLKDFINNIHYKQGRIQLEISFDGVQGSRERIYPNGKESTKDILEVLFKLKEINVPYRIRYTVHKKNINNIQKDIEKIIKIFNPDRIILSENENDLDLEEIKFLNDFKTTLIKDYYNKKIQVPICMKNNEMCGICRKCITNIDEFSLYIKDSINNKKHFEIGIFNDFNLEEDLGNE